MKYWVLIWVFRGVDSITSGSVDGFTSEQACQVAAAEMRRQGSYMFHDGRAAGVVMCAAK